MKNNAIRAKRIRAGMSEEELAARVGVSKGTISNWELGKSEPHGIENVRRLSAALDAHIDELFPEGAV